MGEANSDENVCEIPVPPGGDDWQQAQRLLTFAATVRANSVFRGTILGTRLGQHQMDIPQNPSPQPD